ncbi:methionyl-tRNA synthetase, partial [Tribonema minus]
IGHAYEAIASDCLSRYHRMYGRRVFFQTGTDEHGQKIAAAAEAEGKQPIDICDLYAGRFQELNQRLLISNDFYIRTTQPAHHAESQKLWLRCAEAGDIYLGKYEGWYNEREETFVSDKDAELTDFKDAYGWPLKRTSEASYFFRMGKYQEWLVQYINDHPEFIQPADKRAFILARLAEPLGDLSISRTTFRWGIPVPEGFDAAHVMYVWFDALSNYISSVHALDPG